MKTTTGVIHKHDHPVASLDYICSKAIIYATIQCSSTNYVP